MEIVNDSQFAKTRKDVEQFLSKNPTVKELREKGLIIEAVPLEAHANPERTKTADAKWGIAVRNSAGTIREADPTSFMKYTGTALADDQLVSLGTALDKQIATLTDADKRTATIMLNLKRGGYEVKEHGEGSLSKGNVTYYQVLKSDKEVGKVAIRERHRGEAPVYRDPELVSKELDDLQNSLLHGQKKLPKVN
jgi:hypothetical protein